MSKPVPRSRLNITYRTRIEGVPVKQKLPMRFLVLGDFTGGNPDKLEDREVHSIISGMKVDNFMKELSVTVPIEDHDLGCCLVGTLTGTVTGKIKKELDGGKQAIVALTGRGTVTGEHEVNGLGSFSGEVQITSGEIKAALANEKVTIKDPKLHAVGRVEGEIYGDIDTAFTCTFPSDPIDVDDIRGDVSAEIPVQLTVPLHNMKAFTPEHLAASVPEIRRILVLRRLLLEMRSYISNRSEMRDMLKSVLGSEDLPALRDWLIDSYPELMIAPPAKSESGGSGGPGTSGGSGTGGSGTGGSGTGGSGTGGSGTGGSGTSGGSSARASSSSSSSTAGAGGSGSAGGASGTSGSGSNPAS